MNNYKLEFTLYIQMDSNDVRLQLATKWLSGISLFILIPLGLFGCICNMIIFTSKKMRNNSCAFYFLCTTIFDMFILCFGGLSRLATEFFGSLFIEQNRMFCKIRSYFITSFGTIGVYFVLLASIDRCMSTSINVQYRSFSQMKIAYRLAIFIIVFILLCNVHVLVFFDIGSACTVQSGVYAMFYSIYVIFFTGLLPDTLILLFTFWTFRNTKRLGANSTTINTAKHRLEKNLIFVRYDFFF